MPRKPRSEEQLTKQRQEYQERLDKGLCTRCGNSKMSTTSACDNCLAKKRKEAALRRKKCLEHYGNICRCCGETNQRFLTIDHMNGNGNDHRREIGSGYFANSKLFGWLIRNKFPTGFQTLCFNCNRGKWMNKGICPHKETNPLLLTDFKNHASKNL